MRIAEKSHGGSAVSDSVKENSAMSNYVKAERVLIRSRPDLGGEKWVQDRIAEDPSILGLGDVILKDRERIQPNAGRLDLLLQDAGDDADTPNRYEVEIQLGETNESHIIRTIEYWDIERKRYPQYSHCAVIVAEDVTSRFLNVIGLFNGSIPLIAVQMNAIQVKDAMTLVFTTVVGRFSRGLVDEDEVADVDRSYWETRSTKDMMAFTDELLDVLKSLDASVCLNYNKGYIGLGKGGKRSNFVFFTPKKSKVGVAVRLPQATAIDAELGKAGLEVLGYNNRDGFYRIRLRRADAKDNPDLIRKLFKMAYDNSNE
jgi:hypothetical protein